MDGSNEENENLLNSLPNNEVSIQPEW